MACHSCSGELCCEPLYSLYLTFTHTQWQVTDDLNIYGNAAETALRPAEHVHQTIARRQLAAKQFLTASCCIIALEVWYRNHWTIACSQTHHTNNFLTLIHTQPFYGPLEFCPGPSGWASTRKVKPGRENEPGFTGARTTPASYHSVFTRNSIYAIARICYGNSVRLSVCLSVRLSVCLSHGWISQKRFKLGSRNFHRTVAPSL